MSRGGRRRGNNRLDKAYRAQGATGNVQARLRILATTDLHMHILPYDYFTDKVSHTRGLARTASLIHAARAEVGAENCLLVDNGDFLTGTPMDDEIARRMEAPPETAQTSPHPMISVMNGLGYDAATLGNHDFDHGGVARLEQILEQASFPPFVLANVNRPGGDSTSFLPPPHKILTRQVPDQDGTFHPLRIGITGLLPPQSIRPRRTLKTLPRTEDMVSAAQRVVPALRAQGGADIVLLLAHTGIGEADHHPPGLENALVPLSRVAGGVDAIIGGHAHQVFPGGFSAPQTPGLSPESGHINDVPVAVPGGFWGGSHLGGVIDLDLIQEAGRWSVSSDKVELRAVFARDAAGQAHAAAPEDAEITRRLAAEHNRTLAYVRTPPVAERPAVAQLFFVSCPPQCGGATGAAGTKGFCRPRAAGGHCA